MNQVLTGYGRSNTFVYTLPINSSNGAVLDLQANYQNVVIQCPNCAGFAADTQLTARVAYDESDTLCSLYTYKNPSAIWSPLVPSVGSFAFCMEEALFARRLQFYVSKKTRGEVIFRVIGFLAGVKNTP